MFGHRTPAKKPMLEQVQCKTPPQDMEMAGPSRKVADSQQALPSQKVRRSIGEWEAGKADGKNRSPPPIATARAAPTKSPLQSSVPGGNRTAEAKACVIKMKTLLSSSKNTRTDIKEGIIAALDRLYQLVKEAEAARLKSGKSQGEDWKPASKTIPPLPVALANKNETAELTKVLEEHTKLLQETSDKMKTLQECLDKQQPSYASVTATPRRQPPGTTALHSLIISSKDENDTGEDVLKKVRDSVRAKEGGIAIERVRKGRDRKIIVGCHSKDETDKLRERLKGTEDHLLVEGVKNQDPLIILRDVLTCLSDEDVIMALRNQNGAVFRDLKKEDDRAVIRYRRKARNPHLSHIVLRVSPPVWSRAIGLGALHIDMQKVRVEDQSPLVQCSMCLGYGHSRRFCKETVPRCSHCGGLHLKDKCADWLAGAAPTCCNCTSAKMSVIEHGAFSAECAVRRKWDALARAKVAYC